jgi:hypothetical protein
VTLQVANTGEEPFSVGGSERKATHYVVKVEIGGVAGLVAPPSASSRRTRTSGSPTATCPRSSAPKAPLYNGGPIWRIELASPTWKR